jgi:hypothetical protein
MNFKTMAVTSLISAGALFGGISCKQPKSLHTVHKELLVARAALNKAKSVNLSDTLDFSFN